MTSSITGISSSNCKGHTRLDDLASLNTKAITDPETTHTPQVVFFYLPEKFQARFVKFIQWDLSSITGYVVQEFARRNLNVETLKPLIETNRIVWMDTAMRTFHFNVGLESQFSDKRNSFDCVFIKRENGYYFGMEIGWDNVRKYSGNTTAFISQVIYDERTQELLALAEAIEKEEDTNPFLEGKAKEHETDPEQNHSCCVIS